MKTLLCSATVAAFALSSGMALADDTNPKGAGGAAVKQTVEVLKSLDTNLGQAKKASPYGGNNAPAGTWGAAVSNINDQSNH